MPTKADKTGRELSLHELSIEQRNAIDLLVTGLTDQATAEAIGKSRQTVNVWRNRDPVFRAELNARRLEMWGSACDRLRSLVPVALDALEAAVTGDEPDWRAAVQVIGLAGLDRQGEGIPNLGPYSIGPTNPEAIIDQEARRRRRLRDPLADLYDSGPVSDAERLAVLRELAERIPE